MSKLIFQLFALAIVIQALTGWDFLSLFFQEISTPLGLSAFFGLIILWSLENETESHQ
tara:strand:+ start:122 stop:295 length:174 start_codon:yes stop_codon:yes gene_type:complete